MGKIRILTLLLVCLLPAACNDTEDAMSSVPLPAPSGITFSNVLSTSFTVSWDAVAHVGVYNYQLFSVAQDGTLTTIREDYACTQPTVDFTRLSPDTKYLIKLCARAVFDSGYSDSETVEDEVTTAHVPLPSPAGVAFNDVLPTSFSVSWEAVELASAYSYRLSIAAEDGTETIVREDGAYTQTKVDFTELKPASTYLFRLCAVAGPDADYSNSETISKEVTTASVPWVDVEFSYIDLGGVNALHVVNTANAECVHFYSTTANVNVIGEGYDDEETFIAYLLEDYKNGEVGVYRDANEHNFNNYGAGLEPGKKLFYGIAGFDEEEKSGGLNWFWLEMPAKTGDPVIVLDSSEQ